MDVRFPDGTVIKNVPDGTTKQQLLGKLKAKGYDVNKLTTPAPAAPAAPPPQTFGEQVLGGAASTADIIAESALGTAQWLSYPFRRAAGIVTGETAADIQASQERVQNTLGAPIGRVTGASEGAAYNQNMMRQALTYIGENMDKGADVLAAETGLPKADVVNMMQTVMAAVPVKVPGGKTFGKVTRGAVSKVQDIIDPRAKFYMDVAEGRAPELIAAARRPEAEIIPGVRPTFAQATADVGLPRVAAVGEQAEKIQPTAALARKDVQEAGRVSEIKKVEQTPAARKAAEKARRQVSEPLYLRAEKAGDVVDLTPTLTNIEKLIKENPGNPELLSQLTTIGRGLTDEYGNARVNAKEVSSAIDGIKRALANENDQFIKDQLTTIKDQLVEAIPAMKPAQTAFRKGSQPINEMKIGQYLREKLEAALPEGTQRAGVFAQAVKDAPGTIKRALSGQPRYKTLTEALSPENQARVDRVLMDLSRDARVKEMAQMGREAAPELRKTVPDLQGPNVLSRIMSVANEILRRLEGKINDKMAMEIALEFLDANRAADALETAMRRTAKRNKTPKPPVSPVKRAVRRLPVITAPNQMSNEENRNRMSR